MVVGSLEPGSFFFLNQKVGEDVYVFRRWSTLGFQQHGHMAL
jgi:hypothetical protein